jgi:hypothetical protein
MSEGFTMIPDWLMERSDVSHGAKCVWSRIRRYEEMQHGVAHMKVPTLAKAVGMSWRQCTRYTHDLRDLGLLQITERKGTSNEYRTVVPDLSEVAALPQTAALSETADPLCHIRQTTPVTSGSSPLPEVADKETSEERSEETLQETLPLAAVATPAGTKGKRSSSSPRKRKIPDATAHLPFSIRALGEALKETAGETVMLDELDHELAPSVTRGIRLTREMGHPAGLADVRLLGEYWLATQGWRSDPFTWRHLARKGFLRDEIRKARRWDEKGRPVKAAPTSKPKATPAQASNDTPIDDEWLNSTTARVSA